MNLRRQMPLFRFVFFAAAGGFPAAAMGQPVSPAATVVAGADDRDAGVAALVDAGGGDAAGGLHDELDELRRRVRALERGLGCGGYPSGRGGAADAAAERGGRGLIRRTF